VATLVDQPRDLLLGEDNDLVVTSDAALSKGLAGIAQACRVAVQMFAEEWFLDLDVGIPYLQRILGARARVAQLVAKTEFRVELLAVAGVIAITRLDASFEPTTRTLTVTWQVLTDLGNTPVDTIVLSTSGGV
jgi:hypothetical protein